ncbi:MAG: response regulator transcription factor [Cyanobacteriota bacterium]
MNSLPVTFKILVIEDNENLCEYLTTTLEARKHTVKCIKNGTEALRFLEKIDRDSFDIILLDLELPGANGWVILAKIRSTSAISNYPVIIFTGMDDDATEVQALYDGADDFVPKPCSINVLLARINSVMRNKPRKPIIGSTITCDIKDLNSLTSREREILLFIAQGLTNKEIAKETFITEQTVMIHVKNILKKLKVDNRMQATLLAIKLGLVQI